MDLRRVVVATDLSESAAAALAVGVDLVSSGSGELHVVHVAERLLGLTPASDSMTADERSAELEYDAPLRRRLREWVDDRVPEGLEPRLVLLEGEPAEKILDYARREHVGLLVLGRHGHSALERFFVGSTAEEVVRKAPCLVMIVPPPHED